MEHAVSDGLPSHVFVVGMPRSGTHLMRDVLSSSEVIGFGPEARFMGNSRRFGLYTRQGLRAEFPDDGSGLDPAAARRLLTRLFDPDSQGPWRTLYWQRLAEKVSPDEFGRRFVRSPRRARDLYDLALRAHAQDRIPADKSPANLWYVDTLLAWFPRARVVHMVRDPRAIYSSMLERGWVGPGRLGLPDSTALRRGVTSVSAIEIARMWCAMIALDDRYTQQYPGRYLRCRFEDLVTEPATSVDAVCRFLGLEFSASMLDRSVISSSFMARGTVGFRLEAIEAWRTHLDPTLARIMSRITARDLLRQGYPRR